MNKPFELKDLAYNPGYAYFPATTDYVIQRISIDTRALSSGQDTVFFAIQGKNRSGNDFLEDAYNKGVRQFVVESKPVNMWKDASWLVVPDAVEALQKLAQLKRERFKGPVWAITGSNGKTIVKEWLAQSLADELFLRRSPRSYNSQLGVPLAVWELDPQDEIAFFEAGISQPGEMEHLEEVIQPSVGIFTHLGEAHLENFDSKLHLATEKCKLFKRCKQVIYCADEPLIDAALNEVGFTGERITWTSDPDNTSATLRVLELTHENSATRAKLAFWNEVFEVRWPFTDDASKHNALLVVLALLQQGLEIPKIVEAISNLHAVDMRMQLAEGEGDTQIINDVYNSDPGSFRIALNYLNSIKGTRQQVLIMSDILQSGIQSEQLYRSINELLLENNVQRLITVGEETLANKGAFTVPHSAYRTTEDLLKDLTPDEWSHSAVLVKGARPFRLERVVELLQKNTHETVFEINLENLMYNLDFFNSKLAPDTQMMVMVKAFGYGNGGAELAAALEYRRISYLGVAYVNEGVALRKAGISMPIMVMNPDQKSLKTMIRHRLEPNIYSLNLLEQFISVLQQSPPEKPYSIHVELDTGMHRLGFDENQLKALINALLTHQNLIKVRSVFSHLASADDPQQDEFTRQQIARFTKLSQEITQKLPEPVMRHLANSAGMLRFPEAHFDMVRLGIGIYGVIADKDTQASLKTVGTLRTRVSQIREIAASEPIGYGCTDIKDHPRTIATVPIGYADGLDRRLSNGKGYMMIGDCEARIAGRICMDMTMLDVTGCNIKEGDYVTVFGEKPSLTELATLLDTIPYEILTSIPQRVKRVYVRQ